MVDHDITCNKSEETETTRNVAVFYFSGKGITGWKRFLGLSKRRLMVSHRICRSGYVPREDKERDFVKIVVPK